ncbi:DUF6177 family protein [Amycolatopsis sp. cmx-11-51]|uniref:DUF6177 family protein n=1 Tax=Amycolatopsis sp. cmx-11-51 TaxID=2785797 RepID=UPI0039E512B7
MVEQVTGHPAADWATSDALVVEQSRGVVPASSWLIDAARSASRSARVLQLLTPEHSGLTYPMELLLRDAGAEWIVQEDDERFRRGFDGVPSRWNGTRFVRDPDRPSPPPAESAITSGDLEVRITTVHPAAKPVRFGADAEAALWALTGREPTGWGNAEPVTRPWSADELTWHCRNRAPGRTRVIVAGHGVVGQVHVSPADAGTIEETKLSGPAVGTLRPEQADALAERLAASARMMLVAVHPGRRGGVRSSEPSRPALPYGLLVGQEMVAARGTVHAGQAPAARVVGFGSGDRSAVWCVLNGGRRPPYEQLSDVLRHFALPDTL